MVKASGHFNIYLRPPGLKINNS